MRMLRLIARTRRILAVRRRLLSGLAAGTVVYLLLPLLARHGPLDPTVRAILAWDGGVAVYIGAMLSLLWIGTPESIAIHAERQQEGEWTIFWLIVAAVVFSFAAILQAFAGISSLPHGQKSLHVTLVAGTLFLSWLMTQVTFAFRYAHEYYARDKGGPGADGGLDFPGDTPPDYGDFMYFALVLGMTFQVSDVEITAPKLRRLAAVHGLLGFLFNTIILALTVNIAAGLL